MEKIDDLKRRIDEAAKYAPLEQLAISTQCDFSSDVVGNLISEDDQNERLRSLLKQAGKCGGSQSQQEKSGSSIIT